MAQIVKVCRSEIGRRWVHMILYMNYGCRLEVNDHVGSSLYYNVIGEIFSVLMIFSSSIRMEQFVLVRKIFHC